MASSFRDNLRLTYDRQAAARDAGLIQDWKVAERADFLALLQKEHKGNLLEIGAGPGRDGRFFQDNGLEVTCIDLSPEMVRLCREKGLTARVMDVAELDFPPGSFDAVYAMNSLLHLSKAELPGVLAKISAVLRPAGLFYLGVWGGYDFEGVWEQDDYDPKRFYSYFSDESLKRTVSATFDVVAFRNVDVGRAFGLHFQSLVLRKRAEG